jgi:hypothetical protein
LSPWDIIHGSRQWRSRRPGSFVLSIFLLITNQFRSVQKMKLRKGRVISEDGAGGHLELTRISLDWCPTKRQKN